MVQEENRLDRDIRGFGEDIGMRTDLHDPMDYA